MKNKKLIAPILLLFLLLGGIFAGTRLVNEPVKTVNFAAGPQCKRTHEWKCEISEKDLARINSTALRFRLAVFESDTNNLIESTNIFDTRKENPKEVKIRFTGVNNIAYRCEIQVFDDSNSTPQICNHISGRLKCVGLTPVPTETPQTTTSCLGSNGDVNQDGNVDTRDVNLFVQRSFGLEQKIHTDLNCDGSVDRLDWNILFDRVFGS